MTGVQTCALPILPFSYKAFKIPIKGGFYITLNPALEFEASANVNLNSKFTVTSGVRYDETMSDKMTAVRENKWDEIEGEEGEVGLKIEGSLYLGLNLHPSIKWISDKILSFDVEQLGGGLLINGKLYDGKVDFTREDILNDEKPAKYETNLSNEKTEQHTCISCLDGEISLHSKIKAQLKLLDIIKNDSENKGPSISVKLPDMHLGYFYVVLLDENGRAINEMNLGRCPHKVFLLNFKFKDKDTGEVINDVEYKLTDQKGSSKEFSVADYPKIWREAGTYKISASLNGYKDFEKDYVIEYRPKHPVTLLNIGVEDSSLYINDHRTNEITIRLESIKHNITVNVVDSEGNPIDQPAIDCSYHPSGTIKNIVKSVTNTAKFLGMVKSEGKAENSVVYSLPDGEHTFKVSKAGFDTVNVPVIVDHKDTEITVEMKRTEKNVLITIVDEEGNAIDSPDVKIEGSSEEFIPEMSLPGVYSCKLPIGTYRLSVSKDGYVSEDGKEIAQQEITVGLLDKNVSVTITLKKQQITWQKLYREKLMELLNNGITNNADLPGTGPYKFDLIYINNDDIPELAIMCGYTFWDYSMIFSIVDNQVVNLLGEDNNAGAYGACQYWHKNDIIICAGRYGFHIYQYDGTLLYTAYNSVVAYGDNGIITINDKNVTEKEYDELYEYYYKSNYYRSAEFPYTINEKTISNVLADPIQSEYNVESASIALQSPAYSVESQSILTVNNYLPSTLYNLYILRDKSSALAANNIYYINQYKADENGAIEISYNLEGMKEKEDYFLIPYGYIPENKNIIDEADDADSSPEDYQYTMCVGDIIYFDTEANDLTFKVDDPNVISLSEDGICTAISDGKTNLKIVQNGLKTYNIEITVENAVVIGDVDEDGEIQISDATMALTIYSRNIAHLDTSEYTERQKRNADVNNDGKVDISDATAILTYYAQSAAGLNPTWDKIIV